MMEDCDAARRGLVASVQRLRGPPFAMSDSSQFLFMTCQVGAEPTLKRELAKYRPSFRFAYSRPGFLTYKLPEKHGLKDDFELHSVFARAMIDALTSIKEPAFTASELLEVKLKPAVISAVNSVGEGQTPGFYRIVKAGDEPGSEFVFVRSGEAVQ